VVSQHIVPSPISYLILQLGKHSLWEDIPTWTMSLHERNLFRAALMICGSYASISRAAYLKQDIAKTAQAGPGQRCFACSLINGENVAVRVPDLHAEFEFANRFVGTCKGRVFFCDGQCLKDGWKEHKVRDGCRNPEDPHHRDQKVQSLREMSSIALLRDSNTCCSSIGISVF